MIDSMPRRHLTRRLAAACRGALRLSLPALLVIVSVLVFASPALAQDKAPVDARLEGYSQPVALESAGAALTWLLFAVLIVLCVGPMFKDAKRHYD
jgi:hypothetical protein